MIESIYEFLARVIIIFFVMGSAGGELGYSWANYTIAMTTRPVTPDDMQRRFNGDMVLLFIMFATIVYMLGTIVGAPGYNIVVVFGVSGMFTIGMVLGYGYFVEWQRHNIK